MTARLKAMAVCHQGRAAATRGQAERQDGRFIPAGSASPVGEERCLSLGREISVPTVARDQTC